MGRVLLRLPGLHAGTAISRRRVRRTVLQGQYVRQGRTVSSDAVKASIGRDYFGKELDEAAYGGLGHQEYRRKPHCRENPTAEGRHARSLCRALGPGFFTNDRLLERC